MCIKTVNKLFPEKKQNKIDGKSAYTKWLLERRFDQLSYHPGVEEIWIAGYEDGIRTQSPICDKCESGEEPFCIGCYRLKNHDGAIMAAERERIVTLIQGKCSINETPATCPKGDCSGCGVKENKIDSAMKADLLNEWKNKILTRIKEQTACAKKGNVGSKETDLINAAYREIIGDIDNELQGK